MRSSHHSPIQTAAGDKQRLSDEACAVAEGQIYALDFFWCERHVVGSNLHIATSLEVTSCGQPVVK
jgi:fibro-slime domain-containing protein